MFSLLLLIFRPYLCYWEVLNGWKLCFSSSPPPAITSCTESKLNFLSPFISVTPSSPGWWNPPPYLSLWLPNPLWSLPLAPCLWKWRSRQAAEKSSQLKTSHSTFLLLHPVLFPHLSVHKQENEGADFNCTAPRIWVLGWDSRSEVLLSIWFTKNLSMQFLRTVPEPQGKRVMGSGEN